MLVLIPPQLQVLISSFTPFVPDLDQNKIDAHEELIPSVKSTAFENVSASAQNTCMSAFAGIQLNISFAFDNLRTVFLFRLQMKHWEFWPFNSIH